MPREYDDERDYDDQEPPVTRVRYRYAVAIYHRDGLAYGGPEEGGWWYETGSLERVVKVTRSYEQARKACRRLNDRLVYIAALQRIPALSSVGYAGGRYHASVEEVDERKGFKVPVGYPEQRPRYE